MHLKMGDFIMGMGREFATEAMDISEKMSLNEGNILFSAGDAAGYFYVLLKGQVQLSLGQAGPVVYPATASAKVNLSSGYQPPAGSPCSSWRVTAA